MVSIFNTPLRDAEFFEEIAGNVRDGYETSYQKSKNTCKDNCSMPKGIRRELEEPLTDLR